METLEVHSKDFLIKWVNLPENSIIDWQVKPLKKSINFSIYRKNDILDETSSPDDSLSQRNNSSSTVNSSGASTPQPSSRLRSKSLTSVNRHTEPIFKTKSRSSTLNTNINSGDLMLIKDYHKLISDELVHGKLDVSTPGVYAFIFDNSFSKTIGKKILFSTKILAKEFQAGDYPSPVSPPTQPSTAADEDIKALPENGHVKMTQGGQGSNILRPKNGELLQSVLLKKRRKKLQGFVKRYFVLNIKYGTLSYFRVNDNKLRGQMPINQSIISANVKKLEIIIDSGMEVWDLKALNKDDFQTWIETFNTLKKLFFNENEDAATFHKEIKYNDEGTPFNGASVGGYPTFLLEDLNLINSNLNSLILENSDNKPLNQKLGFLSNDVSNLLAKLSNRDNNRNSIGVNDSMSLFSSEFYDAKEYIDALNGGVVQLDEYDDDEVDEIAETDDSDEDDGDDSSSYNTDISSHEDNGMETSLPVIQETDSHQSTAGNEKEVQDDNDNDNNLYPLPLESVDRPVVIPEWTHPPSSILSFFRKNVGKDLTSIAMPVDMNEPVTILQKYGELVEYCDIINNALQVDDETSGEKILRIAAFAVSGLSSVREKERNVRKPFNPLLGETFELVREDKGIRLISEKVSHRPPVFATFVESKDWTLAYSLSPSQKFWGKTAEINNKGSLKLTIKATGEVFLWTQPTSMLKNIIAGEKYSEPTGNMTIKSTLGYKAVVEFAKGGMFSGRSEDLTITAFGSNKKQLAYSIFGKWTDSLTLKTNTTEKLIWTCGELLPKANKRFGFTKFANDLVQTTAIEKGLAPTDSRLRPDIKAYLDVNLDKAEEIKCKLEEDQRVRRKEMEQAGTKHKPLFFHHVSNSSEADSGEWVYVKGEKSYWNRRPDQDWDDLLKLW